jgi:antitoxin ParD1/3/4
MSHSGKERGAPSHKVVLTEQQEAMIEQPVHSGRYQNASEVLRDGLLLVQQREAENKARLVALRRAASAGLDDFTIGRYRRFADGEAPREYLAARAAKVSKQRSE